MILILYNNDINLFFYINDINDINDINNDNDNLLNSYNTKLFKFKYLVENKLKNDLLDYDNNIYYII